MTVSIVDRDGVRRIRISRAERANALSLPILQQLRDGIREADADDAIRLTVLEAEGRHFSAGADVSEDELGRNAPQDTAEGSIAHRTANAVTLGMLRSGTPVMTVVQGYAVGVASAFVLGADYVIATPDARIRLPFVNLGLLPDGGATGLLASEFTHVRASALALFGEDLDAPTAVQWGVVNEVVAVEDVERRIQTLANRVTAASPAAVSETKRAVTAARVAALERAMTDELAAQVRLVESGEFDRYRQRR